ncbi:microcompartment protein CcmL/EutN [Chromobacterium alkanivorans]|uniref:BMC domain-containing protein n=1 Tax=Chromobacterium alkanivorans TaxID=1071719 RepID=UPI0021687D34|nr:BMC domain-containing protein [Chromobacterium alkanivorans]MCS3803468.1 microcompartment protein CcmL/EutN [Chromobacterium alkanivorans]MCS3817422.1 microcompartment protein CcmL/EutN [Chromobacterium alkanivorans]MCS3872834.1 microcompartment protein CcmL/EutN [Chromobacterium alkanivorans]
MPHAIALIELSSIARGIEAADAMLKSAHVELLAAKTICPGKFIVLVGGDAASVEQAAAQGRQAAGHLLVDHFSIARLHPDVLPAISGVTRLEHAAAVGVVESYSVAACIAAADLAAKTAEVTLIRIHLAFGIGGKCYFVLSGDVAAVSSAIAVAAQSAGEKGLLVQQTVIPRPAPALLASLL